MAWGRRLRALWRTMTDRRPSGRPPAADDGAMLRAVIDALPVGVALKTADNRIVMMNRRTAQRLGREPAQIEGRDVAPDAHEKLVGVLQALDRRLLDTGRSVTFELDAADYFPGGDADISTVTKSLLRVPGFDAPLILTVTEDVTEARRSRREAEHQSALLRAIADTDPNVIFVKDEQSRYLLVNRAYCELYGLSEEQLIGRDALALLGESARAWHAQDEAILRGDREVLAENRQVGPDGRERVLMIVKRPLITPEGRRLVLGVGVDITERKRQEDELARKHAQLRAVMDAAPNIIFVKDARHRYVMVNRAYCEVWGRSEAELVGRDPAQLMGPAAQDWNAGDDEVLRTGREVVSENRQRAADGGERVILQVKRPFPGPGGEPLVLGIGTDITDLRRQADQLARQQQLINDVIDLDRSFVLVKDAQLRYVLVNDAYARRLGRPKADIVGRTAWELHPGHPAVERMMAVDRQVLATGEAVTTEDALDLGDGPRRFVATRRPIGLPDGTVGVLSFIQDVTELRATEESLRVALEQARAASVAKSRFLANMSHEIRTPINGVAGMIDLVLDAPVSDQQREWLRLARGSADTLLALVNDVLDLSKIEAGVMTVERVPFALQALLADVVRLLAARAREKGLLLDLLVDPALPDRVFGDALRLRQVLLNLVGNAVKFTERGGIRLRTRGIGSGRVAFEIDDDGPGIAPEQQRRVFDPFVQGDDSATRRHGGTGLGLSISAQLVELMGGRLQLDSAPGRGARFFFDLDLAAEPVPMGPCLAGWRIAWLGHDGAMAEHAVAALRAWGAHARFVAPDDAAPDEGLRSCETWVVDREDPPWIDAAIARARQDATLRRLVRLAPADRPLGVHAASLPSTQGLAGATLHQPVAWPALLAALGAKEAAPPPPEAPRTVVGAPFEGWRVLLAEDNDVNGMLAVATLERLGADAELARDGVQALERLQGQRYDAVLMDIQMPHLDGLQALKRWRAVEAAQGLPRTPVLAMTAHAMRGDRERFLAEGFDGYVGKPFERAELVAEVRRAAAACRN